MQHNFECLIYVGCQCAGRPKLKSCPDCGEEYYLFHNPLDCKASPEAKAAKKDKHPNRPKKKEKQNKS